MNLLSRRSVLAIAAVVDVALHSRSAPVAAKALAARHKLPPRHLETLLQGLVHAKILKGVRGPRGGYELARAATARSITGPSWRHGPPNRSGLRRRRAEAPTRVA